MKLFYDNLVYSLQKFGGISAYWYELSKRALDNEKIDIHFYESRNHEENIFRQLLKIPASIVYQSTSSLLIERFSRVRLGKMQNEQGVFHSSYFRLPEKNARCKKVCTVHDFVHDRYYKGPRLLLHNIPKRKCILESDLIITVSQNTKADLLHYYPQVDADKVIPVYNGVSELYTFLALKSTSDKPYVLFVGSRFSYKNFNYCINLLKKVQEYDLYIVGSLLNEMEQKILRAEISGRYKQFSNLSIQELNVLYNNAFCLIYPSSYEGFGIPLVEAMAAGCPFIAYNRSSIPEVAGNAGVLLQSLDIEEGINALKLLKNNYMHYRNIGIERAKNFSWDKCYQETNSIYKLLS